MRANSIGRLISLALLLFAAPAAAQQFDTVGPPTAIACAYNTAPPTLATGKAGFVQCDSSGRLLVSGAGGGGTTAIDQSTPGTSNGVTNYGYDPATPQWRPLIVTTTGALEPPTAATSSKITKNNFNLVANTTYTIPANASRIAIYIICLGGTSASPAPVEIDETGAAITAISTTTAVGSGTITLPQNGVTGYAPPITSRTAITLQSATAQACHATEYNR